MSLCNVFSNIKKGRIEPSMIQFSQPSQSKSDFYANEFYNSFRPHFHNHVRKTVRGPQLHRVLAAPQRWEVALHKNEWKVYSVSFSGWGLQSSWTHWSTMPPRLHNILLSVWRPRLARKDRWSNPCRRHLWPHRSRFIQYRHRLQRIYA